MAYNRATVERVLPAIFDPDAAYGVKNEQRPDPDMPKGHVDKKKGSDFLVHLADLKTAWAKGPLSFEEKQALYMQYFLDCTQGIIASFQGVTQQAVSYRCERGVGKLAAHLNGEKYIDGYDGLEDEQSE